MTNLSPASELRGPSWLLSVVDDSSAARRVHRWWQWAVLSLGCVSGCASWSEVAHNSTQPLRATGNLLTHTGDRISELFEPKSTCHRNPENLPAYRGLAAGSASQTALLQKAPDDIGDRPGGSDLADGLTASGDAGNSQYAGRQRAIARISVGTDGPARNGIAASTPRRGIVAGTTVWRADDQ